VTRSNKEGVIPCRSLEILGGLSGEKVGPICLIAIPRLIAAVP
jgi:hypothetical protein